MQRLPAARPAGRDGERGVGRESSLHSGGVADEQRSVEAGARDPWMQRKQPLGAIAASVCRGLDELLDGRAEFEVQFFDALAKPIPRVESVLASDHRLRVVKCDWGALELIVRSAFERREDAESRKSRAVACAGGMKEILCQSLELFEVGAFGELPGRHVTSMLNTSGPQAGQHGTAVQSLFDSRVDSVLRADPQALPDASLHSRSRSTRSQPVSAPSKGATLCHSGDCRLRTTRSAVVFGMNFTREAMTRLRVPVTMTRLFACHAS